MRTRDSGKTPDTGQPRRTADRTAAPAPRLAASVYRYADDGVPDSPAQPSAAPLTEEMQARRGTDFCRVPVHTDSAARACATEAGARARAFGPHVVIGPGTADQHTLGNELTPVMQQHQGPAAGTGSGLTISNPAGRPEAETSARPALSGPSPQHTAHPLPPPPAAIGTRAAIQRMLADAPAPVQRSAVPDVLRGPGQPLAPPLQEEMAARFGADFSQVRVHTDAAARASAAEVGARAYTSGSHVVIGDGGADKHTLAHELTHVIQQRQGPVAGTDHGNGLKVSDPSDRDEKAAEANAARVMRLSHELTHVVQQNGGTVQPTDKTQEKAQMLLKPDNNGMIQRLREQDYPVIAHRDNVRDSLLTAIRANITHLDWSQLMPHINAENHNTPQPQGNASTFGGVTQQVIAGYVRQVIQAVVPELVNDVLRFDSTGGGFPGIGPGGQPRNNVRVILNVGLNDIRDDMPFSLQLVGIIVANAYPIN